MEEKPERLNQETKISRREFFRKGITLGISLTAFSASLVERAEKGKIFPLQKERVLINPPEGYKIGMVLGIHGEPDSPSSETTPIKERDLYFPVGAIFLDESSDYLDPKIQEILPTLFSKAAQKVVFFQEPIEYALKNDIPIILGDITFRGVSVEDFLRAGSPSLFLTSLSSALASAGVGWENFFRKEVSRRKFFKILSLGGALGAIHFSTGAIVRIGRALGIRPDSEIGRNFQAILSDITHPEEFAVVMRNIVWALKCRDFYERGEIPKDKIINVIGGAGHQFFDFFVRHPEKARGYWKLFGYKKVAAEFSGGDPSWVYQSYVFNPAAKRGRIITHESLKELVA